MLLPLHPPFRRRRGRPKPPAQAAAPVALTLVQAELIFATPMVLRLRFDRAINTAGLVAGQITVQDPSGTGFAYVGAGAGGSPPDAQTLDLELAEDGSASGTIDRFDATAATGIAAVDDGGTWAGVSGLPLPYP